jgi:hypothetical protein
MRTWRNAERDLKCLHLHATRVNVGWYLIYQTVRRHIPVGRNNDTSSYSTDSHKRNVLTLHHIRNNLDVLRQHTTFIIAKPIAATCFGCTKQPSSSRVNLINMAETCSCYSLCYNKRCVTTRTTYKILRFLQAQRGYHTLRLDLS